MVVGRGRGLGGGGGGGRSDRKETLDVLTGLLGASHGGQIQGPLSSSKPLSLNPQTINCTSW